MVTAPIPSRAIRRREQGIRFGGRQEGHHGPVMTSLRDREHLTGSVSTLRDERERETVEGVDRGQAGVTGRGAVVPVAVEVGEELADGDGVQVVDREP